MYKYFILWLLVLISYACRKDKLDNEFERKGKTYIPDDNFEKALIDLELDDILDDYVETSSITELKILDISRKSISDLTGISDFDSLEELYVEVNDLMTLDVSENSNLKFLRADRNFLSCVKLSDYQYNTILPEIFANSYYELQWSIRSYSNESNPTIYNVDCDTPNMENIIFVTSKNDSDFTLIGRDSKGEINGSDPKLNFKKGDAIYFYIETEINGVRHYFHLKTAPTIGTANQVNVPSGTYRGIVIWKPKESGTYYYQCRLHSGHGGTITIR